MQISNPYLRLMRLHQPTGIWLVFWPCAWALILFGAAELIPLFFAGAFLTRSAGCIMNDMADRELDRHVARTKTRPLASGELNMRQAALLLSGLGFFAALLLGYLWHNYETVTLSRALAVAVPTVLLTAAYPFMKRITWWPQAFLGITINLGVFFVAMVTESFTQPALWLLYAACFFWTLGYDTIYGNMDKTDDEKIGIKSTSRHLAGHARLWISSFFTAMVLCMAGALLFLEAGAVHIIPLLFLAGHLAWQVKTLDINNTATCMRLFKSNVWLGAGFAILLAAASI